jgi:hypothetical protein
MSTSKPTPRRAARSSKAKPIASPVASALTATLISPNECDRNFEAANVVDGLFAIARALHDVANAIRESDTPTRPTPAGKTADRDRDGRELRYVRATAFADTSSGDQLGRFIEAIERATGRPVKRSGSGWIASCPCDGHRHDDRNPSLSIAVGHTQPIVVKCQAFAEHNFEAVCRTVGLDQRDFMRRAE